jgi:SSS family solute:Na+ symporter
MNLLTLYFALFVGMGVYEYVKRKDFEEFAVAGRRSGSAMAGVSIAASCVGASATVGMTGLAFSAGTPAFWWLGSGVVGLLVLSTLLAAKVRQSNVFTLPDMARKFVSPAARRLTALIIIPAWLSILAAQYLAAARTASALADVDNGTALLLCAAVITAYTMLGGQNSILKSDAVQYAFVAAGLGLALAYAGSASPVSLRSIDLQLVNDSFPLSRWTYFMLIVGGSYVVCPMLFGRLFSTRGETQARRGALLGAVVIALSAAAIVCIGLYARGLAPAGTDPDSILTHVIPSVMPGWAGTLLLFALFSAIISSADSCLLTAATVLEHDMLGGTNTARCRWTMLALGLGALVIARSGGSILSLLLAANDIYVCGVVAPMFVAILAWKKRPLNANIMLLAMLAGGTLGIAAAWTGMKAFSFAGVGLSLTLSIAALVRTKEGLPQTR